MFLTVSLLLAASPRHCRRGRNGPAAPRRIPWPRYQLIGLAELAAASGIVIGLRWHPLGIAAAAGMVLLLLGAVLSHRRAADTGKETAPALIALAITTAYLAVALTS